MSQEFSREELADLVETIMTVRDKNTGALLSEKEHHALVIKEEIVDLAMKGI